MAGFVAAIAVAALTGRVTLVHLIAMALAYLAVAVFVAYLVRPDRGRR